MSNIKLDTNPYQQNDLTAKAFAMVAEFTRVKLQALTSETTLFHSLSIDGEDAVDFFEQFAGVFGVDLTDFKIEEYFGREGSEPLTSICTWIEGWWTGDYHRAARVIPITLGDLVKAAQAGRWVKSIRATPGSSEELSQAHD